MTGALGDSWAEVYANSPAGKPLFTGTVEAGGTVRFGVERAYRRYFVRARSPRNLSMTINGRPVDLPAGGLFYVTARRVTPARASS